MSGVEFTAHTDDKNNPHAVTKEQIELGNVDNTADADKPISIATQKALNQKANTAHAHAATDITLDSAHRFVTDSEKSTWNGKANASHTHTKSQITDFPSSLPASDVYGWAKASVKPSYHWDEVTEKPSTFAPSGHSHG